MTRRKPALTVLGCLAVLAACGGGGKPSGCQTIPNSQAEELATKGGGTVTQAAQLPADGGVYTAATIKFQDGSDATPVWFQTNGGTGLTLSVGAVTALFSDFPDSKNASNVSVTSSGYEDVQKCLD